MKRVDLSNPADVESLDRMERWVYRLAFVVVLGTILLSLAGCVEGALRFRDEAGLPPVAAAWATKAARVEANRPSSLGDVLADILLGPVGAIVGFGGLSALLGVLTPRRGRGWVASSPRLFVDPTGIPEGSTVILPEGAEILPRAPAVCGFCGHFGERSSSCPKCGGPGGAAPTAGNPNRSS